MANMRMMPSGVPAGAKITGVSGRSYTATPGAILDVPDFDMPTLRANNWQLLGIVGTTAQRPAFLPAGVLCYIDTTLGKPIFFDGLTYRDFAGTSV